MHQPTTLILETKATSNVRLRTALQQHEGFVEHRLELERDSVTRILLTSPHVDQTLSWPSSPPWQELHVHEIAGVRTLMLVGRAGASHWSMAVSADDSQLAIVFDVACRVRSRPEFLGTTSDAAQLQLRRLSPSEVELRPDGACAPAVVLQTLSVDSSPPAVLEALAGKLIIRPALEVQVPATIRWKYCVRFAG